MHRIYLVHWRPSEAASKVAHLAARFEVECGAPQGSPGLRPLRDHPPAAVIVDLDRAPAQGRDIGLALRQYKDTRHVPLVFAGGVASKVERVRELLPDATFAAWDDVLEPLRTAIDKPIEEPIVPAPAMAGYSGRPLAAKLGIKKGITVGLIDAPEDFESTLGSLPEGVSIRRQPRGRCDLVVWFTKTRKDLKRRVVSIGKRSGRGGLWIAWPKKASGVQTDVTQEIVRATGLGVGLVDYKICAIDATWSGLRFAWRKKEKKVVR